MIRLYLSVSRSAVLLLMLVTLVAVAQERTVSGKVTSEDDGSSIPGVNILEKGTTNGTASDVDGNYTITVGPNAVLVFSFVGYTSQEIPVNGRSVVDVALPSDVTSLSEVVVIGYGEVKKSDVTGAVVVLNEKNFNKGFQTSPEQLIQGQIAGVQVTPSSGAPGAAANIRVRGTTSIRAGNNPLIVLDGVPLDGRDVSAGSDIGAGRQSARNPLNFINPNDIESVNVLKDASATAIYGSRGSNGVIIITTKKGTREKPELSYAGSVGVSWMPEAREYDMLDASQFVREVSNPNLNFGSDVDAFEEILRTGVIQDHNVTYGGSTQGGTGRYRLSLGYQDQEGIIKNTSLQKYTGSLNVTQNLFGERVKIQSTLIASYLEDENAPLSDNVGAEGDLIISALRWNPTRPFLDNNGNFIQPSDNERNPLAFLEFYDDNTETTRIFANVSATVNLFKGLDYKVNFGVDRSESERRVAISRVFNANFAAGSGGIGNIENIRASSSVVEHTLTYNSDITPNFSLNALLGYSYQQFNRRGNNERGTNFLVDDQTLYTANLNFASSFPPAENSSFNNPKDELQSVFGRVNVDLFNRFLITATLRADGSSRFGEDEKYGYFPSAAIAYRLANEDFIPDTFSDLKVRVGWGITGNQEFPSGSAQNQYQPLTDGSGIQQTIVGNPGLQWEQTTQLNFGIDFGFWGNRLTGSVDYYTRKTEDLLFRLRVAQQAPDVFVWRNLPGVEVVNDGFDIGLTGLIIEEDDVSLDIGINVTLVNNELRNVSSLFPIGIITGEINGQGLSQQRAQLLYDNQPLYAFYLPIFTGYNEAGFSTFADLNGDGENTASGIVGPGEGDRAFVGDPNPNTILGIRSSLRVGNFDASIYLNGSFGNQVFDNTALALFNRASLNGGANVDERVLNSGQAVGDPPVPSTQFLEDGDFLRLSNLTIGYSLPNLSETGFFQSLRFYVTGQNLLLFTGYNGFDPEVNVNKAIDDVPSFGIDYSAYPRARSVIFGLNVTF